jgi:transcriptional regulator
MYIPKYYEENDTEKLVEFMQANSFAVMVTAVGGSPWGTHLPFVVKQESGKIVLTTHMSRANEQWKTLEEQEVLVIFTGPHAYISPSSYEKKQNVPTWNYIAAHAYGKPRIISEQDKVKEVLEAMIHTYEEAYYRQWKELSQEYVDSMIKGIVAFDIEVTRLQGKYKLSQNKTVNEQRNIISKLEKNEDSSIAGVAKLMKDNLEN